MKYLCTKSISIGEQDTSHFKVEVFTKGLEYPCIDGLITDNIGVKRSINKPKFKDHFEPVGEVIELSGKKVCAESFNAGTESERAKHIEMYQWLLGYTDFPSPPKVGRPAYWWRTDLRNKLGEMGIKIQSPEPFIKHKRE